MLRRLKLVGLRVALFKAERLYNCGLEFYNLILAERYGSISMALEQLHYSSKMILDFHIELKDKCRYLDM